MGAGGSLGRRAVIRTVQPTRREESETSEEEDDGQEEEGRDTFRSSVEAVDADLECEVLEPSTKVASTGTRQQSVTSTQTVQSLGQQKRSPPAKLTFSRTSSSGSFSLRPATPSPTKSTQKVSPAIDGKRFTPSSPTPSNPLQMSKFSTTTPLQQRLSECEAQLKSKTEENSHLRHEIKLQQGYVAKLRAERDDSVNARQDALERCRSIEIEKDRVMNAFEAFRDGKESELSALLRTKEELESRLLHTAQWRCAKCFSSHHPGIGDTLLSPGAADGNAVHGATADRGKYSVHRDSPALVPPEKNAGKGMKESLAPGFRLDIRVYLSASVSMSGEVNHFLQMCSPLGKWCAAEGCHLTLVNGSVSSGSTPQLVRSSSSTSQADNISAILKQEVESCDIYVAFLGNDTHKFLRDEVDGGLLNDDVSNRLCVFCFRDSPSEESPVLPGQPVSKPPTGLKSRAFSSVGSRPGKAVLPAAALEQMISASSHAKIIRRNGAFDRATAVFEEVNSHVQQLLRRSRDVPTANMNLDVIVKRIDRDMDRRLDAHRHRQDSLQEGILERSSSYPLIPALEQFIDRLDEHVSNAGPLPPLLLLGDSGSGKTTLLAHWIANHQRSNRTQHILYHFVTSSSSATANVRGMTQRFVCHLMYWLGVRDYSNTDLCRHDEFPTLLDQVSSQRANGVVLVLDGIENIKDLSQLTWILEPLPVETRVVISSSTHDCPEKWKSWPTLVVDDVIVARQTRTLLRHFLGPLHNLLVPDQEALLCAASRQTTSNPLYAAVLSRHLASDSDPSTLAARIKTALACESTSQLLRLVFAQLKHIVTVSEEVLKKVFCFMYVSQDGVAQEDMLELCNVTWITWLRLRQVLLHHLLITHQSGLVCINGPAVTAIVMELFLKESDSVPKYRSLFVNQLLNRFRSHYRGMYICEELMHQFHYHSDPTSLERFLLDADVVLDILISGNCPVLLKLWQQTGKNMASIASLYAKLTSPPQTGTISNYDLYRLSMMLEVLSSFLMEFLCQPAQSISLARRCLTIREDMLDPDHPSVARALHCLADVHLKNNQVETSVQLLQQATGITEDSVGAVSRQMADHLCLLGMIAKKQNREDAAEQFQLRAISTLQDLAKITEESLPQTPMPDSMTKTGSSFHSNTIPPWQRDMQNTNQQAMLYFVQGDYHVAEALFSEVLQGQKEFYGEVHPEVAQTLHNLGILHTNLARFDEAASMFEKCLAIRRQLFDGCNKSVLTTINMLAALYRKQGKYAKAQPFYRQALEVEEKCFGPNHLNVASALSNLAATLYHTGDYQKAQPMYTRALRIYTDALGERHSRVLECEHILRLCKEKMAK